MCVGERSDAQDDLVQVLNISVSIHAVDSYTWVFNCRADNKKTK